MNTIHIIIFATIMLSSLGWAKPIRSTNQSYSNIFFLHKTVRKEPHIQIIVTPPGKVGRANAVFVEAHNHTNEALAGMDFNVELLNNVGLDIKADLKADPMPKNGSWSSGGQEFLMPKNVDKGKLPHIKGAIIHRIVVYDEKGAPKDFKIYLDINRS